LFGLFSSSNPSFTKSVVVSVSSGVVSLVVSVTVDDVSVIVVCAVSDSVCVEDMSTLDVAVVSSV
jgi:hypothetical protein